MSIIFDLPYAPSSTGNWVLSIESSIKLGDPNERYRTFPSRDKALSFVVKESVRRDPENRQTIINIEGADGKWRAFTQSILPV